MAMCRFPIFLALAVITRSECMEILPAEPLNLQLSHGEPHGHRKFEKIQPRMSSSSFHSPDHFRSDVGLHSPHHSPQIYPVQMYPLFTGHNGPRDDQVENNLKEKRKNFSTSRDSSGSHHNQLNEAEEAAPSKGKLSITSRMSIIIVGLLVILCCVVSFAALIMNIRHQVTISNLLTTTETLRSALAKAEDRSNLCLPCADLSLGPFPENTPGLDELLKRDEDGHHICCAKTSHQTSVFLNLFAKRKQEEKCAQELINSETKPSALCNPSGTAGSPSIPTNGNSFGNISAHLQAGTQPSNLVGDVPIRNWSIGPVAPGTHLTNIQLSHDNHSLVIPESGRYFLYSQVGFLIYYKQDQQDTLLDPQDRSQSLFHSVYRYNVIYPLGDQELLRSDVTQCWEQKKDYGRYTSYVGASVQLNKGDLIYVKVSKIQLLAQGEAGVTYFGLFKIG
ncbi:uncharacterized protein LOC127834716 isoform X1 [Dreissena polymorpha]|uniref:uncharacterized protein LOC127834716 isoform X1 n=1 Tax=Dreissena polymorpha TaxID=45954 RepID=UPI0022640B66|nr:uncharacterized protein LOC127834716 isoform X1 [Dreissena polymorpha]